MHEGADTSAAPSEHAAGYFVASLWSRENEEAKLAKVSVLPAPVEPLLRRFASQLRAQYGSRVREIVLFGSWSRGKQNEESDLDVLVVVDGLTSAERRAVFDCAYDLDAEFNEELMLLSPLCYSTEQVADIRARERRLLREIDESGVPL
jgi:predicted nucleotidyltransferase